MIKIWLEKYSKPFNGYLGCDVIVVDTEHCMSSFACDDIASASKLAMSLRAAFYDNMNAPVIEMDLDPIWSSSHEARMRAMQCRK